MTGFKLPDEYVWTDEKICALCEMAECDTPINEMAKCLEMPESMILAKMDACRHAGWISMNASRETSP